jgi:hypothetical protein
MSLKGVLLIRLLSPAVPFLIIPVLTVSAQTVVHRSNIPNPERAQIIREAQSAETTAEREAKKQYKDQKQFLPKQRKMQISLEEKYYFQVCRRHRISHQQLITIMSEGIKAEQQRLLKAGKDSSKARKG